MLSTKPKVFKSLIYIIIVLYNIFGDLISLVRQKFGYVDTAFQLNLFGFKSCKIVLKSFSSNHKLL